MDALLYKLLQQLVVKNNIQLHKEELKLQLLSHPSYPSLHSVTGVLDHFGVPNAALKVPSTFEVLEQAPQCFLASIVLDSGNELVLVEKKKASIKITYQEKKPEIYSIEKFIKKWTGIVVAIEKDDTIKKPTTRSIGAIGKWFLFFVAITVLGFSIVKNSNLFAGAHYILSAIGLVISIFIVKHELGSQSSSTNSICNLSENTSCDAILNSKGATLFGFIKLSDIGLVAFATCCLCWSAFAFNEISNFTIMSIVTLLALPFTLYSLYYQSAVVKKWCPLCLGIVSVLLLQLVALISFDLSLISFNISVEATVLLFFSLFTSIGVWGFIKPLLQKQKLLDKLEVQHYKFKRNFSLFNALFKEKKSLFPSAIPGEIVFGNENAQVELILVTSPLCHFCKQAHRDIEKILAHGKNKVKISFRFMVDTEDKTSTLYKIVSQLLHIYHKQGKASCLHNLSSLYKENANVNTWLNSQNLQSDPSYDVIMQNQKDWSIENKVNFTPAFFVNHRAYPNEYDRTDLLYFLENLIEQMETNTPALGSRQPIAS